MFRCWTVGKVGKIWQNDRQADSSNWSRDMLQPIFTSTTSSLSVCLVEGPLRWLVTDQPLIVRWLCVNSCRQISHCLSCNPDWVTVRGTSISRVVWWNGSSVDVGGTVNVNHAVQCQWLTGVEKRRLVSVRLCVRQKIAEASKLHKLFHCMSYACLYRYWS